MEVNNVKPKRSIWQQSNVLVAAVWFLFTYGCVIFSGLSESEVQVVESPTPPVYKTTEPVVPDPPMPVKNESSRPVSSLKKPLSKQEIRQIQARLKAVGFDPGPIDGVWGPKTKAVLLRVQSGCAIINELVATSDTELVAIAADTQAPESTSFPNTLTKAEIELVQKRLKDAGFEPGPIDGILGSRTRLAISRCKAGCTALNGLFGTSDKRVSGRTAAIQSPPASTAAKPTVSVSNVSSNQDIRLAQERLKAAGLDPGPIDGILGSKTKSALKKYRSSQKLTPAGIGMLLDY